MRIAHTHIALLRRCLFLAVFVARPRIGLAEEMGGVLSDGKLGIDNHIGVVRNYSYSQSVDSQSSARWVAHTREAIVKFSVRGRNNTYWPHHNETERNVCQVELSWLDVTVDGKTERRGREHREGQVVLSFLQVSSSIATRTYFYSCDGQCCDVDCCQMSTYSLFAGILTVVFCMSPLWITGLLLLVTVLGIAYKAAKFGCRRMATHRVDVGRRRHIEMLKRAKAIDGGAKARRKMTVFDANKVAYVNPAMVQEV